MRLGRLTRPLGLGAAAMLLAGGAIWYGGAPEAPQPAAPKLQTAKAKPEEQASTTSAAGLGMRFAPRNGEQLAYRFSFEAEGEIDFTALVPEGFNSDEGLSPKLTEVRTSGAGTLELRYYDAGRGTWEVAATIVDPSYEVMDKPPDYVSALGYPFAFRMDSRGRLSDFRFAKGTPGGAKSAMRSLVQSAEVILPATAEPRWQAEETDGTGTYAASYEMVEGPPAADGKVEIRKKKVEYLDNSMAELDLNHLTKEAKARVEGGETKVTISPKGAWFGSLEQEEEVVQTARGRILARVSARTRMSLEGAGTTKFPDEFAAFQADLDSAKYLQLQLYARNPALDEMAKGLDIVGAVEKYLELRERDKKLASAFLINYLRMDPKNAELLVAALAADPEQTEYDEKTHLELWLLITEAGHPQAQQAVIGAALDPENSDRTRIRAMAYASDFKFAEPELVDRLWKFYGDTAGDGPDGSLDRNLKAMSILALGVLDDEAELDSAVTVVIPGRMTEALQGAQTPWDQEMALRAIGNSGNSELLEVVEPYFQSENTAVRKGAYEAVRGMEDPQAQVALVTHYNQETNTDVRLTALKVLSGMDVAPAVMDWARRQALSDGNEREQIALVNVLGKTMRQDRRNENTLRQLLAKNPPRDVQVAIYRYVEPSSRKN